MKQFVPAEFKAPLKHDTEMFTLQPLTTMFNDDDYEAWTSSVAYIRSLADFRGYRWPTLDISIAQNNQDIERHGVDFGERRGFTYTMLDLHATVIGCVYIYPDPSGLTDALVRSWTREAEQDLDRSIRAAILNWLENDWPFETWRYGGATHRKLPDR